MTALSHQWCLTLLSLLTTLCMITPTTAQTNTNTELNLAQYSPQSYKAKETHGAVDIRVIGEKENRVFLFVPAEPALKEEAPIIFFHHGWQGMNPMNFGALIDHLVRSGHVVIYPVFQDSTHTNPLSIIHNAGQANQKALRHLAKEFQLTPKQGQILYYGFSIGSAISVNLALTASDYDLPPPNALILVAPGDVFHLEAGTNFTSFYTELATLPSQLPVVIMTGEDDDIGLPTARKIYAQIKHIPRTQRILYTLPSSQHITSKVTAGHGSPGAPDSRYNFSPSRQRFPKRLQGQPTYEKSASLNQLDFFGYWKIIDGVLDGLKNNSQFPTIIFGKGYTQQRTLGTWDDGTPLNPMNIEKDEEK